MIIHILSILVCVFIISLHPSYAADIEPAIIALSGISNTYTKTWTVPADHTLVIQRIEPGEGNYYLQLTKDALQFHVGINHLSQVHTVDYEGIRIPEGYTLSTVSTTNKSTIFVLGTLISINRILGGYPNIIPLENDATNKPVITYTVPTGYSLQIRQVQYWAQSAVLIISNMTDSVALNMSGWPSGFLANSTFTHLPVIPSGWTIALHSPGKGYVFGSLANENELLASTPAHINSLAIAGQHANMSVLMPYPSRAGLIVEKSSDLIAWTASDQVTVIPENQSAFDVNFDIENDFKGYYRSKAFSEK